MTATRSYDGLRIDNIVDNETVHQRCLLVTGTCHNFPTAQAGSPGPSEEDFVLVKTHDTFSTPAGQQNWPVAAGAFRGLVMLQPGSNRLEFQQHHGGSVCGRARLTVQYVPLLQRPPLHLAVLVARDSPLVIDCPPVKHGAVSTAHATLDAAIAKLRMTAYMWQAYLAEDLRGQGLGCRSFRLDEHWTLDTTRLAVHHGGTAAAGCMANVARVHVVRSERSVAELRHYQLAQLARGGGGSRGDELLQYFEAALAAYGEPFSSATRPVVAGLVLDAHYAPDQGLILAHAALASHRPAGRLNRPAGLSLALFGSHLTYAWPRYLEEVPACLLDARPPGDGVAHDRGRYPTLGGTCAAGQGALLALVARAFGASGTARTRPRSWARRWRHAFVAALSPDPVRWELADALTLRASEHFRLPDDAFLTEAGQESDISLNCVLEPAGGAALEISCLAGLAQINFFCGGALVRRENYLVGRDGTTKGIPPPPTVFHMDQADLVQTLDPNRAHRIEVCGLHGKTYTETKVWDVMADRLFLPVPGTELVLTKRSVKGPGLEQVGARTDGDVAWATLLRRRHAHAPDSHLAHATRIGFCANAVLDRILISYSDGTECTLGKPRPEDRAHMGADYLARMERTLGPAESFSIARVDVTRGSPAPRWRGFLCGVRMALGDGTPVWGRAVLDPGCSVETLTAAADERIIGLYGRSDRANGFMREVGIITAPRAVVDSDAGLPMQVFDMPELTNTPS